MRKYLILKQKICDILPAITIFKISYFLINIFSIIKFLLLFLGARLWGDKEGVYKNLLGRLGGTYENLLASAPGHQVVQYEKCFF